MPTEEEDPAHRHGPSRRERLCDALPPGIPGWPLGLSDGFSLGPVWTVASRAGPVLEGWELWALLGLVQAEVTSAGSGGPRSP